MTDLPPDPVTERETIRSDADATAATRTSDADVQAATRSSDAAELVATRHSDAEILAVTRHQRINLIWEWTQAFIAVLAVVAAVSVSVFQVITSDASAADRAFQFLTNTGLLVIGFYFGRTNHTRPTGESPNPRSRNLG